MTPTVMCTLPDALLHVAHAIVPLPNDSVAGPSWCAPWSVMESSIQFVLASLLGVLVAKFGVCGNVGQ